MLPPQMMINHTPCRHVFQIVVPLQGWKENVQKVIDAPQDFDSGSLEFSKVRALYESYSYSTVLSSANKISHCCLLFCCAQEFLPEGNAYLWLKKEAMIIICNNCHDDAYDKISSEQERSISDVLYRHCEVKQMDLWMGSLMAKRREPQEPLNNSFSSSQVTVSLASQINLRNKDVFPKYKAEFRIVIRRVTLQSLLGGLEPR